MDTKEESLQALSAIASFSKTLIQDLSFWSIGFLHMPIFGTLWQD